MSFQNSILDNSLSFILGNAPRNSASNSKFHDKRNPEMNYSILQNIAN